MTNAKDYVMIIFGIVMYAIGFCAFILPHEIIIGGLTGVGALVYFATGGLIPVAVTQYACNLILLTMAFKIVGKTFVMRTIFGATVAALAIEMCIRDRGRFVNPHFGSIEEQLSELPLHRC